MSLTIGGASAADVRIAAYIYDSTNTFPLTTVDNSLTGQHGDGVIERTFHIPLPTAYPVSHTGNPRYLRVTGQAFTGIMACSSASLQVYGWDLF
jgi:hypothetical protein